MPSIHPSLRDSFSGNSGTNLSACSEEQTMTYQIINSVPCEQQQAVTTSIEILLSNLKRDTLRKAILQKINDIPEEQLGEVVMYAASFCENLTDTYGRDDIIQEIIEVPQEQRANFIAQVMPFCQNDTEGEAKAKILNAIRLLLSNNKMNVLREALPFCQNLTSHWTHTMLRIVDRILTEQERSVLTLAAPLCQHLKKGQEKATIIEAIKEIPHEERDNTLERTVQICKNDGRDGLSFMLKAIHQVIKERREDIMQKAKYLDTHYRDRDISGTILKAAIFFPPALLDKFIKAACKAISKEMFRHNQKPFICTSYFTGLALREDSSLKEPLYQHLGEMLDSITQKNEANLFSRVILNSQESFMIDQDHWLFKKALEKNLDSKWWCSTM